VGVVLILVPERSLGFLRGECAEIFLSIGGISPVFSGRPKEELWRLCVVSMRVVEVEKLKFRLPTANNSSHYICVQESREQT
jgi:hypothetical protein